MKKIILFPFNGNAKEAASAIEDINESQEQWQIVGFIDDDPEKKGRTFGSYSVLGGREKLADYSQAFVLAVPGRPDNYQRRAGIINSLNVPAEKFAAIIHPSARIGINCKVGFNVMLLAHVVLTANVTVNDHVVVLPNTVISHDSVIGSYSMLGSTVSVSGSVSIGTGCYIGSGTRIIQEVSVGENALVGLGSVVLKDVPKATVVAGNPAREIVS